MQKGEKLCKRKKSVSPVRSTGPVPFRGLVSNKTLSAPQPKLARTQVLQNREVKTQASTPATSRRPLVPRVTAPPKIADLQAIISSKTALLKEAENQLELSEEEKKAILKRHEEERKELLNQIEELRRKNQELEIKYQESLKLIEDAKEMTALLELEKRKLLNDLVDSKGKIRVGVRVRPMSEEEKEEGSNILSYPGPNRITYSYPFKNSSEYRFEHVFGPTITQKRLFDDIEEFILSVLNGYNVAVIAFGQTGSGKTFTMRGQGNEEGIIPRSGKCLFANRDRLKEIGWQFKITASFVEVYNDEIFDLLGGRKKLELRQMNSLSSDESITRIEIKDLGSIDNILQRAERNRSTGVTKCNESSSRSHAIFEIKIEGNNSIIGTNTSSVLHLVDLAGSERVKESGVEGQQLKETSHINKSLTVFCRCIASLRAQEKHIPYRDSKLTSLLSTSLGAGSSKTLVIVNLSPAQAHETKRSLDFANEMALTKIGAASKNGF